jgi:hypothetical protein
MILQANRARVFLSCGQAEGEEKDTAIAVAQMLENELGFTVYVAGAQMSFEGVKEAIFRQLVESEYFLFIDLPRGEPSSDSYCSGSLFANQELAVAAYLGLEFLGFRHDRVRPQQGLLRFVQSDFPVFKNNVELLNLVRERVKSDWRNDWRRGLQLKRREDEWDDMTAGWQVEGQKVAPKRARFFHLDVVNQERDKIAVGCMGYIDSIRDVKQNKDLGFRAAELKWAGSVVPAVPVFPRSARMLDACVLAFDEPRTVYFTSHSDSGVFMSPIADAEMLDIGYVVVSENMHLARATLRISLGKTVDDASVIQQPLS